MAIGPTTFEIVSVAAINAADGATGNPPPPVAADYVLGVVLDPNKLGGAGYRACRVTMLQVAAAANGFDTTELQIIVDTLQNVALIYHVAGAGNVPAPLFGVDGQYAINLDDTPWSSWHKVAGVWVLQPRSDLLLPSGGAVNFNSGDVTITHSANLLTFAGGDVTINGKLTAAGVVSTGAGNTNSDYVNGDSLAAAINLLDTGTALNSGGQIVFSSGQGVFAGLKGLLRNGAGPAGDVVIQTRTTAGNVLERQRWDSLGNVVVGKAALATSATDGFLYIPACAGTPTGVPTAYTGRTPLIYDTTNNRLYKYNAGWKGGGPFGFRAHKNGANQDSITHNAYTKVTLGTEAFDVGGFFDTVNSRWTPPAGLVQLNGHVYCTLNAASSAGPTHVVKIVKNGVTDVVAGVGSAVVGAPGLAIASVSGVDLANGTDYYEMFFFFTSANGLNDGRIDGNLAHTHFSGATLSTM